MLGANRASMASLANLLVEDKGAARRASVGEGKPESGMARVAASRRRAANRVRPQSAVVSGGGRVLDPASTHRTHRLLQLRREQEETKAEIALSGVGTFHDQVGADLARPAARRGELTAARWLCRSRRCSRRVAM